MSEEDVTEFKRWLKSRSFILPAHLDLIRFDGGYDYGLSSQKPIEAGEILFSLPESLLVTPNRLLKCQHFGSIIRTLEWHRVWTPFTSLVVWLMIERCSVSKSEWGPYLHVLPKTFHTPPYYPANVITCFPQHIQWRLKEQRNRLKNDYETLRPFLIRLQLTARLHRCFSSYKLFRWAWCCVNTRCVSMPDDQMALAPFLDFLNHTCQSQVTLGGGFNVTKRCYEVVSANKVEANAQVFISYGHHSNYTLAMEYGFVVPFANPHCSVLFTLDDLLSCMKSEEIPDEDEVLIVKKLKSKKLHLDLCLTVCGPSWCFSEAVTLLAGQHAHDLLRRVIEERTQKLHVAQCKKRRPKCLKPFRNIASVLIEEELDILRNCEILRLQQSVIINQLKY